MKTALLGLALSLTATACLAHGELPEPEWCSTGRTVAVATFTLFPEILAARRDECQNDGEDGSLTRECGQFDDDYDISRRSAQSTCDAYTAEVIGPGDIGSVIVLVDQPATYLDAAHHEIYQVEHGLSGTCVRCEPLLRPIAPLRSR